MCVQHLVASVASQGRFPVATGLSLCLYLNCAPEAGKESSGQNVKCHGCRAGSSRSICQALVAADVEHLESLELGHGPRQGCRHELGYCWCYTSAHRLAAVIWRALVPTGLRPGRCGGSHPVSEWHMGMYSRFKPNCARLVGLTGSVGENWQSPAAERAALAKSLEIAM